MCAESISLLMGNIDAVTESKVDLSTGTVHVDLDPSIAVTEAQLRSAIDDGGFTFRSIAFEK
jgi:copper chaperone CopZ